MSTTHVTIREVALRDGLQTLGTYESELTQENVDAVREAARVRDHHAAQLRDTGVPASTPRTRTATSAMPIIATTTVGTTLADFADRSLGIGYAGGSSLLLALLLGSLFLAATVYGLAVCYTLKGWKLDSIAMMARISVGSRLLRLPTSQASATRALTGSGATRYLRLSQ